MKNNTIREVLNWLQEEINSLQDEINVRTQTLNSLQNLTNELTEFEDYSNYKERYDDIASELEQEKMRLVKLHDHYRQMETEFANLKQELKSWQDWFYSNKNYYDRLFSTGPPIYKPEPIERVPSPPPVKKPAKKKNKAKIKRKKKK